MPGTKTTQPNPAGLPVLEGLLGSKSRARLLTIFVSHPTEEFYAQRLTTITRLAESSVRYELGRLERLGVLVARREGREKYFRINDRHPLFPELKQMVYKTAGLGETIRQVVDGMPNIASLGMVVLVALCLVSGVPALAQPAPPIIDLHFHPSNAWDAGAVLALFDRIGVAAAGNGPAGPDSVGLGFGRSHPTRFLPFCGLGEITYWLNNEGDRTWRLSGRGIMSYLGKLEVALRSGQCKGIGELFPNNLRSHDSSFPGFRYPVDSPMMRRLWEFSAKYQVPLSVHAEADAPTVAEMERLLDVTPTGVFIWAHTGFNAEPPMLRELLQKHANLFCELSFRDERRTILGRPISLAHQLRPEWQELFESFSDRFVIGTDTYPMGDLGRYESIIGYWREILGQLSHDTAERIAHQNAEHIMRLTPSSK